MGERERAILCVFYIKGISKTEVHKMNMNQSKKIEILMFPWLAHGHISPFLELAKRLSAKNLNIYFCSTPINLSSIKVKLGEKHSTSSKLVEFHLPTLPELPPEYHTTKSLPPELMPELKQAFDMAKPNFSKILEELKPDLVICDLIQPWVSETASEHNIPAVEFITVGAAVVSFMLHVTRNPNTDFPFPEIYLREYEKHEIAGHLEESSRYQEIVGRSCDMILIKTFRGIEGKYFDYLSNMLEKKVVPVGPLVEDTEGSQGESESEAESKDKQSNSSLIMEWLNRKNPDSTIFVSFGSELSLSKQQIEELAHGIELSNVNFVWVIRFQKEEKTRVEEALPEGFLERIRDRGIVVEGWAPQCKILRHRSIGGFVSHCGWSSVMEALKWGIPIIAIPIVRDELINARVLEHIGVGAEAVKDENGGIQRTEVAKVIKQVMVEGNGEKLRSKARLVSGDIRNNGEEEIEGLVKDLVELCNHEKSFPTSQS